LTALITGKIDYFGEGSYSLTAGQAEQVLRDFPDKVVLWDQFGCCGRVLKFSTSTPPFDNQKARLAVHLAIDREEWAAFRRVTVGDLVVEGTKLAYVTTPGGFYSIPDEELKTWPGLRQPKDDDIAQANVLLDEVFGAGNRPTADCLADAGRQSDLDACLFVIDQMKRHLGIVAASDFLERAVQDQKRSTGGFDFIVTSLGLGYEPDRFFPPNYVTDVVPYTNAPQLEGLFEEFPALAADIQKQTLAQSREVDPLKRRDLVWALEKQLAEEVTDQFLLGATRIMPAHALNLKGWVPDDFDNRKWSQHERIWLAK